MRLRNVSSQQPGWRRIRRGRGFSYVDAQGDPLPEDQVQRIRVSITHAREGVSDSLAMTIFIRSLMQGSDP